MQKTVTTADGGSPVVVFTCGRTGSTLLIRILNCLPQTIMWGEHNGFLKPLLTSYARVREVSTNRFVTKAAEFLQPVYDRQPILSGRGMTIEWLNWFSEADIDRIYREMITGLFYPEWARDRFSRWGFKEIQYRNFELGLLRQLFPGMKAIILYRNPAAVLASQFTNFAKKDGERLPRVLGSIEGFYQFAAQQAEGGDKVGPSPLFISYEEVVGEFDRSVCRLQDFLGEEFSDAVAEIGNNIARFNKRRTGPAWSGNPLEDFDMWQRETDVKLPSARVQAIAEHYETVRKATAAKADTMGAHH